MAEEKEKEKEREARLSDLWQALDVPFYDPKLREKLEKELPPLDVEQLLLRGYVTQTIQIAKNVIVTFRSLTGNDRQSIARVATRNSGFEGPTTELVGELQLAASIESLVIGGKDLFANYQYPGGGEELDRFLEAKLKVIQNLAEPLLLLLSQHLTWFADRLMKQFFENAVSTIQNFCPPPPGNTQQ